MVTVQFGAAPPKVTSEESIRVVFELEALSEDEQAKVESGSLIVNEMAPVSASSAID